MLLEGRGALVVGGGQAPGETIGNGRATAIQFAREGARVVVADRDKTSAEATVEMIRAEGGDAIALEADVCVEAQVSQLIDQSVAWLGSLDVLHNNVGIGQGDAPVTRITEEAFDHILQVNLRGMVFTCKHALPTMRQKGSGVILNISSLAAIAAYPAVAYKTSKAAVIALTEQLAASNARYGVRANVILPGLMNTPMAVEGQVTASRSRAEVVAERDRLVPLGRRMGSAWDVAHAAAFLASDRAAYITGAALPVDGGLSVR